MNKYLSDKLRVFSLILMVMVVFIHSYNLRVTFNSGDISFSEGYNAFVQNFVSQGLTRIAVPIFFCISAYLFFLNIRDGMSEFVLKYRKRVKSLLIPYLLWSIYGVVLFYVLQKLPQSRNFFTNHLIADYSFKELFRVIFFDPIPYQLWFVRDLIVLVFLSPIVYWMTKYLKILSLILLFIVWLNLFEINLFIVSSESIFFFYLGAYLSLYKREWVTSRMNRNYYLGFTLLWFLILLIKTSIIESEDYPILNVLLLKLSILIGLISVWSAYDITMNNKSEPNKAILNYSTFSFFLYVSHEPILTIVKKGLFNVAGGSELLSLIIYLLAPIIVVFVSLSLGWFLKKNLPKFYGILTGGR